MSENGAGDLPGDSSAGEYYAHTAQERFDLGALAKDVIGNRLPLIIGTGAVRTEYSVAFAKAPSSYRFWGTAGYLESSRA